MISGALSMGVGGYLSAKADRASPNRSTFVILEPFRRLSGLPGDHFRYLRDYTRQRIRRSCVGEVEREVTEVLQQVGLDESLCRTVALRLLKVENELNVAADERALQQKNQSFIDRVLHKVARKPMMTRHEKATAFDAAEKGLSQTRSGSTAVAANEFGVTAFLLKFAEGQEDVPNLQLLTTAVTIGIAYALGSVELTLSVLWLGLKTLTRSRLTGLWYRCCLISSSKMSCMRCTSRSALRARRCSCLVSSRLTLREPRLDSEDTQRARSRRCLLVR